MYDHEVSRLRQLERTEEAGELARALHTPNSAPRARTGTGPLLIAGVLLLAFLVAVALMLP